MLNCTHIHYLSFTFAQSLLGYSAYSHTHSDSHPSSFLAMLVIKTKQIVLVALLLCFQQHFLLQAGGELRHQTIGKLAELADYDLLVNCGGLRAGKLFGDDKVIPVRCLVSCISGLFLKSAVLGQTSLTVLVLGLQFVSTPIALHTMQVDTQVHLHM